MTDDNPVPDTIVLEQVPCPLCGGQNHRDLIIARDYFCGIPGEYRSVECRDCGHQFLNPRPTEQSLSACYPEDYGPHVHARPSSESQAIAAPRPWYARPPFRWIPGLRALYRLLTEDRSEVVPVVDSTVPAGLEIGCGRGDFLSKLQDAGWDATGIEPSPNTAANCQARGLNVTTGTIESAEIPAERYDAVFAWMVVEHVIDPASLLRRAFEALKPGGCVCFSVPNRACWEPWIFGRYWLGYDAPRHLHHFSPKILRRMLSDAGFQDVRILHQRNQRYAIGSAAAWLLDRNPQSKLGQKLMSSFRTSPPLGITLLLAPKAIFLAFCRQSGRLTVIAKKPPA